MPGSKTVSKEAIIDAAEAVLRIGGFEADNARSVAKALGCSTQPIISVLPQYGGVEVRR